MVSVVVLVLVTGYILAFDRNRDANVTELSGSTNEDVTAELYDAKGESVNFEDFKGKIVFVNSWATWCPPCVAEMPTIEQLKQEMPEDEVVFVMVSYDRNPQKSLSWMKKKEFDLPVYFPAQNFPSQFMTDAIPATFVLDRKGEILYTYLGMADYSKASFVDQMQKWIAE